MTAWEMLKAAGPVFAVLLLISIYVLYLWILRFQVLRRFGSDPTLALTRVNAALMQRDLEGAIKAVSLPTSVNNVLRAGLQRAPGGRDSVVLGMNEAAVVEEARLMTGLPVLATIATTSPMLGLLGTVLGMIHAFQVFSRTTNPGPGLLASGISEALINTAAGLIVAMLAYWGRNLLKTRAEGILLEVDRVREALPGWVLEAQLRDKGVLTGVPMPLYRLEDIVEGPAS